MYIQHTKQSKHQGVVRFFKAGNKVVVDFIEVGKPSRMGKIEESDKAGFVLASEVDGVQTSSYIPFSSVSEVHLKEKVDSAAIFRQQNTHYYGDM